MHFVIIQLRILEGLLCARYHVSLHNDSIRKVNYTNFTDLEPESLQRVNNLPHILWSGFEPLHV